MIRPFVPFPELTTERLRLRDFLPGDEQGVFRLRSDPVVSKILHRAPFTEVRQAEDKIARLQKSARDGEDISWAISPIDSDAFLGSICLWDLKEELNRAEIGYELLPEHRGGGAMREAALAVVRFGFERMRLSTIIAYPPLENPRSVHLLESCGFRRTGEAAFPGDDGCELTCWQYALHG